MRILIIEDEQNNANRLVRLLHEVSPELEVIVVLTSNAEVRSFFKSDFTMPDVILADIQLGDGLSFDGLKNAPASIPIIFTTAYDQYAVQAFKYNSIDYLLKPIVPEELDKALQKVADDYSSKTEGNQIKHLSTTDVIARLLEQVSTIRYRERFLISYRDTFIVVPVSETSHIGIKDGVVRLYTTTKKTYILDLTLNELENQLDPIRFMRVNRQLIVNAAVVEKLSTWFLGKLRIHLKEYPDASIIVSRDKSMAVRKWLDS